MKNVKEKIVCLNCGKRLRKPELYCSEECKFEAKFVRYFRRCIREKRINDPDIIEALEIRLAHILAGGYPESERSVSPLIRAQVIHKAKGLCQKCGKPGDQIDHIKGSSNNLKNLQLLCRKCHNEKTKGSMVPLTPDSESWLESNLKIDSLMERVYAKKPLEICDDDINWVKEWRSELKKREKIYSSK